MTAGAAKPLRLAFLGCGSITQYLSRIVRRGFRNEIECLYASRDARKAEQTNSKHGGAGHFSSYDEALSHPAVDVLWIATPPDLHLALTLRGLRQDKDVIVEKPAFMRVADFDVVKQAQAETGRRVLVAENYLYKPLTAELQRILDEELIGEVLFVQVNALKRQLDNGWRTQFGAFFEGGVHWVNLVCNLGLEVESVYGFRVGPGAGVERSMLAVFQFKSGAVGTITYSWELSPLVNPFRLSRIFGRKGTVTFESNGAFVFVRGIKTRLVIPKIGDMDGRRTMIRDFLDSLRQGTEPALSLDLAKRDYLLLERIYETSNSRPHAQA